MITKAEKVYDCLQRVRYRYSLGSAVNQDFVDQYANGDAVEVSYYDARDLLPLSRITFQIRPHDGSFLINGALELFYVTITYMRSVQMADTRRAQEALLEKLP